MWLVLAWIFVVTLLGIRCSPLPSEGLIPTGIMTMVTEPENDIIPTTTTTTTTDDELIRQAQILFDEEKLLASARVLRRIRNPEQYLKGWHLKLLKISSLLEEAVNAFLLPPPIDDWTKRTETHGKYDTNIFFKVEAGGKLTCRIETPIPQDMLVPILSVLNESTLYETWIPSWKKPIRIGVKESKQILNDRKGHQVIKINCNVPWPMSEREVLMDVTAVDDIEETGCIIAKMQSIDSTSTTSGESSESQQEYLLLPDTFKIPVLEGGVERVDFDGSILFRACPKDYPHYENVQRRFGQEPILLQYIMSFDAKLVATPTSLVNFVTRVVIGRVWSMLLEVAEEVRREERMDHIHIIQEEKGEFYQWLKDRCARMMDLAATSKKDGEEEEEKVPVLLSSKRTDGPVAATMTTQELTTTTGSSMVDSRVVPDKEWTMVDALRMGM